MFKFLKALVKLFAGVPLAIAATVLIGATAFIASGFSAAGKHYTKAGKLKSYDPEADTIADFLSGMVKSTWAFAFSGFVEIASDYVDKREENRDLKDAKGIPYGTIKVPDNVNENDKETAKIKKEIGGALNNMSKKTSLGKSLGSPEAESLLDQAKNKDLKGKGEKPRGRS